jgi:cytidine deaminase
MDRETLLTEARKAALNAYSPYSHFRVGAAVVVETTEGPRIVIGANVENASFGLTLCAERTALATACTLYVHSMNEKENKSSFGPAISYVAISCIDVAPDAPASLRTPCGACRQWLAELAPEAIYYVDGIPNELRLTDLLPLAFCLDK